MTTYKISNLIEKIIHKNINKQGILEYQLIEKWPTIVGSSLAHLAKPVRLKFIEKNDIIIILGLYNPYHNIEIEFNKSIILEKVNLFFGLSKFISLKLILI